MVASFLWCYAGVPYNERCKSNKEKKYCSRNSCMMFTT